MMIKNEEDKRNQVQFVSAGDLVPKDHLLRDIERAINFSFIYELVVDKYSKDRGRPSIDPVMLIKIPLLQYLYGIGSMRQTIKEIEVNVAYRWFLGLDLTSSVPHFSTFGKNYTRRFKGTDLFEQIFKKILEECMRCDLVDPSVIFVDATHIKANANTKKHIKQLAEVQALHYEVQLRREIDQDRQDHDKKPLKDKDDNDEAPMKEVTQSTTDPESGLFHKGEHKRVFAYTTQTACDQNGWIIDYSVHPGNEHDSRTFPSIYQKLKSYKPEMIVMDAGYKTPAIAKLLIDDEIKPLFPYKRPMTQEGFFKKYDYVYDEYFDCYLCPNEQVLKYFRTDRDGYQLFRSNSNLCTTCPYLMQCTHSSNHQKVVTRHLWESYLDICEDIRHTLGAKAWYDKRKETIERIFGTAKEFHGMRYTRYLGKALMEMKIGLTYACLNLKKLAKMKKRKGLFGPDAGDFFQNILKKLTISIQLKKAFRSSVNYF
jgi:transposase